MDWLRFKRQLAREANEYLADLREIRDDLKSAEGWFAFALVVLAGLMTVAWLIVSLGFNPENEHVSAMLYRLGLRSCRPIENFSGVIVFIDFFLLLFLTAITLGNCVRMLARVKRGWAREPRDLIISTLLMLVVGVGGIVYMRWIC
jgi:hypothetical protein